MGTCLEPRQLITVFHEVHTKKDANLLLEGELGPLDLNFNANNGNSNFMQSNSFHKVTHAEAREGGRDRITVGGKQCANKNQMYMSN
jgi:hypothetical protein